ncbi:MULTISPECIES: DUF6980 family protein [unclassified Nitrospina]|uniref:DUF6980 family protein n=1 Tax=unclassified Nitrospina TaxID=2638683 RepID=UPI003F989B2E
MKYCCEKIKTYSQDDTALVFWSEFREFGIRVLNGGSSINTIDYCPWCGTKLSSSLRDRWFDELEKLGFDEPTEQDYPEEFKTEEWWEKRNL